MAHTSFASRLDEALIAAPHSLDRIVDMLAEQGLKVSQATLSHWRSGRSMPKRHNSFLIISALEDLLGLTPQSLSSLLSYQKGENTTPLAPVSGKNPSPIESDFTFLFKESDAATDWNNEIQRELLEVRTVVSSDFLTQNHTFIILARVPQVEKPCLHVNVGLDDSSVIPEAGYVNVYNVEGVTIGERKVYANGHTTVTRLDLPSHCYPGQLHRLSFAYSDQSKIPFCESFIQSFAWPLHFYINRIEFEGKVPEKIEWIDETIHEEEDRTYTSISTRPVVPIENTAQICIEKPTATRGYFRWE